MIPMNEIYALLVVLAIAAAGLAGGQMSFGRIALAEVIPYAAAILFLAGFCWRIMRWAWAPVPFHIPVTCGQQKSFRWIRAAKIDNPSTQWGVLARMAAEILLFRSLFRNSRAQIGGGWLILSESGALWLSALAFHWALLLILLRHLRLFLEPVPAFVNALERLDSFFQLGAPPLYLSDVVVIAALGYLLIRRFRDPAVRFISLFTDYFGLFLLLAISVTGVLMRYFTRIDVLNVKELALGLAAMRPQAPQGLGPIFFAHLLLVCALASYLPFSKLMHMGGIFLSPTRNLANNSRSRRHINPWNHPVKTHTYPEWEKEFREKLQSAGIPVEIAEGAGDAGNARTN
ncbi:Hdr-like menaquinol oxidoreductase cytochrome b-like subunit [Candidatus Sulfotelmatomonas gaucii]|uniref:Hdr-like menaquinol oxidoreductase cytochrome b-like subunit n=1 Tax=Candidatus Sulfuritelmatomonas gaucii TaxID=2043161 RepID=A0A2N9M644_9BACT|nr:Hdr-like menaquinol oxidoreductase cytochrome b-like subunit [Candidatus Sulfotelmatomonas gaucii]